MCRPGQRWLEWGVRLSSTRLLLKKQEDLLLSSCTSPRDALCTHPEGPPCPQQHEDRMGWALAQQQLPNVGLHGGVCCPPGSSCPLLPCLRVCWWTRTRSTGSCGKHLVSCPLGTRRNLRCLCRTWGKILAPVVICTAMSQVLGRRSSAEVFPKVGKFKGLRFYFMVLLFLYMCVFLSGALSSSPGR